MSSKYLLILSFFLLSGICRAASLGGWKPIPDLKAPEVQEAAQFAVSEHNKAEKLGLGFEYVERGEQQVVSGMNYRLVIAARDGGGADGKYEAVVYVKPWAHYKSLTSFKKL